MNDALVPRSIPFVDLALSSRQIVSAVVPGWIKTGETAQFLNGPEIEQFEECLCRRLGTAHAVACANGTDALILSLMAAGVKPGDIVAMPDVTFWATYEAIVNCGATPLLVDIDPHDLQMGFDEFCAAWQIHQFSFAMLPHLMGWASGSLDRFRRFCCEKHIVLIEDGAQAFGVLRSGAVSVCAGAYLATLSFYPAKVFGGCMDGGAIVMNDSALAEVCRQLRNHGRSDHYTHVRAGWNSRMSTLQAIWLLEAERLIDAIIAERNRNVEYYHRFFEPLSEQARFYMPPEGVTGNGYLAVLCLKNHSVEHIARELRSRGIETGRTYPVPISRHAPAAKALRISDLKYSREFCAHVINLPVYPGIPQSDLHYVAETVAGLLK